MIEKITSTKTIEEAFEYSAYAQDWQKRHPNSILTIYMQKLAKPLTKALKPHNKKVADERLEQASITDQQDVKKDAKGDFEFKKDGLRIFNEKIDKWSQESITFEAMYSKLIPPKLTAYEVMVFSGFVIDPARADQILAKMEDNSDELKEVKRLVPQVEIGQQNVSDESSLKSLESNNPSDV